MWDNCSLLIVPKREFLYVPVIWKFTMLLLSVTETAPTATQYLKGLISGANHPIASA